MGNAKKISLNCSEDRVVLYYDTSVFAKKISGHHDLKSMIVCTEHTSLYDVDACVSHYFEVGGNMKSYVLIFLLFTSFSSMSTELRSCTTKLRAHMPSDVTISVDLSYIFLDNETVLMAAFGDLTENKINYIVNRQIEYQFNKVGDHTYKLSVKSINKSINDSYDGKYIGSYLLLGDNPVVWNITEIGNNFLFSNGYAPVFLCVSASH